MLLLTENCSKFKLNFFLNFRKKIALQAYKSSRIFASIDNLSVAGIEADRVPEIVQNDCFLLLRKAAIVCLSFLPFSDPNAVRIFVGGHSVLQLARRSEHPATVTGFVTS